MKLAVVFLALVAAVSAQSSGQYNPYNPFNQYNNQYNRYNPYSTPAPFRYRPSSIAPTLIPSSTPAPFVTTARPLVPVRYENEARYAPNAEILKYGNEIAPDGSYNYFYETSNGIAAQAQGTPRDFGGNPPVIPVVSQGSFAWTSPEGVPIAISYIADENGYQPSGDALPTPPPIPPQIARALQYIAARIINKK